MGSFNTLNAEFTCPRCSAMGDFDVYLYFGARLCRYYRIGDRIEWVLRKAPQNGGRPENGCLHGEAYFDCPLCHKDAHMLAIVENDVITAVIVDETQKPYVPD